MNKKTIVQTDNAPKAIGPYSQGVGFGEIIFFSGQIPLVPETMTIIDGGIEEQTNQVISNIDALLKSQNLSASNVIKATVFLSDIKNFDAVNVIYSKFFVSNPPARSCFEVARLPKDSLVEIEIIAHK